MEVVMSTENKLRFICQPIDESIQSRVERYKKQEEESISAFNKKYTDEGKEPPLYEEHRQDDWVTRIYPNGRMDITAIHRWKPINTPFNQACKELEKPRLKNT